MIGKINGSAPYLGNAAAEAAWTLIQATEAKEIDTLKRRRDLAAWARSDAPGVTAPGGAAMAPLDGAAVQDYLRRVFPAEGDLTVTDVHLIRGGRSKETVMIGLTGTGSLPDRLVMRGDVVGGLVPSRVVDEFPLLQIAQRHGIPLPTPLHAEPATDALGRSFILVHGVSGRSLGDYFPEVGEGVPPSHRQKIGLELAGILARLHAIPLSEFEGTRLDLSVDLRALVTDAIESTYAQARSFADPPRILIELAYRWLKDNIDLADDRPCVIHCNVGLHNMLIDGDRISALLDWELACVASPAREIAKILHLIDYLMLRQEFYAVYVAAGGPANAVQPERVAFYAVMNSLITNQRVRYGSHLFYFGAQRNMVTANVGYDYFLRNSMLLSKAVEDAQALPGRAA
ncbi:MAG: phosphotransferase family protein [Sphingobium sp.]